MVRYNHFFGLDTGLVARRFYARYAAVSALCVASVACREATNAPVERPIAEVAREVGSSRVSTDPAIFASLLEQVSARRRIIVGVRSAALPPVRTSDALSEPAWEDMIMLLPAPSDTSSVERSLEVSSRQWTAADVDDVATALRSAGVSNVQALANVGLVMGDLPHTRSTIIGILQAIGQHPNADMIEPSQSRAWHP